MKSLRNIFITWLILMSFTTVSAEDNISVTLNGTPITFDQPPIIKEGRTLVPVRAIFEALGADVVWDSDTRTVTATREDTTVKMTIDKSEFYKNEATITLDVPAQIVNDRTLVPVRAISEAFDADVDWNADTRTVIITKEEDNPNDAIAKEKLLDFYDNIFPSKSVKTKATPNLSLLDDKNYTSIIATPIEYYFVDINNDKISELVIYGEAVNTNTKNDKSYVFSIWSIKDNKIEPLLSKLWQNKDGMNRYSVSKLNDDTIVIEVSTHFDDENAKGHHRFYKFTDNKFIKTYEHIWDSEGKCLLNGKEIDMDTTKAEWERLDPGKVVADATFTYTD